MRYHLELANGQKKPARGREAGVSPKLGLEMAQLILSLISNALYAFRNLKVDNGGKVKSEA